MLVGDATAPRPKQKLQPAQAYSVLHYRKGKQLKTIIDAEWAAKPASEKVTEDGDTRGPRLNHRNKRMEELYAAESQDVIDEVDAFRNAKDKEPARVSLLSPEEDDLDEDDKERILECRLIQRAIENLDSTVEYVARSLHRYTRGSVFISVLANEPSRGGQLALCQYTAGTRVSDGKDMFQASPEAVARFTREQRAFARACADDELIRDMRTVYPQRPASAVPVVVDATASSQAPSATVPAPRPAPANDPQPQPHAKTSSKAGRGWKFKKPRFASPVAMDIDGYDDGMDIDFDKLERFEDDDDGASDGEGPSSTSLDPSSPSTRPPRIVNRVTGDDGEERVQLEGGTWLTQYEYFRECNIAKNRALMKSLGIDDAVKAVVGPGEPAPEPRDPRLPPTHSGPPSRIPPARASKEGEKI
ncbi:hypothetical protein SCHPADRAFT_948240 [Schizopora paradoxa]|uniref:Uncharacterized protein n=1 Tax=Schizopora paradoxa TaxID=27342 RepID=A0A0H2QY18_9AGAM|nr:hypothetical protein SCHPADRAFT_948240 [Schizopora paradoxa]